MGKSEPPVNLRINTHRYDVTSPKGGAFDKHFNQSDHNYNENARFILIEQMRSPENATKLTIRQLLEDREDYWMSKLKTLIPDGLNDRLNSNVSNQIRVICS